MLAKKVAPWLVMMSLGLSVPAAAEVNLEYGGLLQSNIRFRYEDLEAGNFYERRRQRRGVARNEHILKLRLNATTDRFGAFVDVDFVWLNFARDVNAFEDLTLRENTEATRFEAHSAYVEALDLLVDGLDLRIGQQIVAWGVGDGFNPTNNINSDDVEDRLLYGIQQANWMGRLSYTVPEVFSAEAILVPVFKPALLPQSAVVALALVDRLPMLDPAFRYRLSAENAIAANEIGDPNFITSPARVANIDVDVPGATFGNMQFGFRLATTVWEQDIAISYYQGFSDIPLAARNLTVPNAGPVCDPDDETRCVDQTLDTTTTLTYPKIRVVGLNMSGELDLLSWISDDINPIGYRIEVGLYFPEERRIRLFQDNITIAGFTEDGEYDYNGLRQGDFTAEDLGDAPLVLDSTPYAKWVVGLDYTFGPHVYLNIQWVHGLVEEVGAGDWITEGYTVRRSSSAPLAPGDPDREVTLLECVTYNRSTPTADLGADPAQCQREILRPRLGDYLVLGLDFNFDSSRGLLRLFAIFDVTTMIQEQWSLSENRRVRTDLSPFSPEGFSMVLFPELNYNFGYGFELGAGALVFIGRDYTKFGDPAAGGSVIWTRGRFSF